MKTFFRNVFRTITPRMQDKLPPLVYQAIMFTRGVFAILIFTGFSFFLSLIPGVTLTEIYLWSTLTVMVVSIIYFLGKLLSGAIFEINKKG